MPTHTYYVVAGPAFDDDTFSSKTQWLENELSKIRSDEHLGASRILGRDRSYMVAWAESVFAKRDDFVVVIIEESDNRGDLVWLGPEYLRGRAGIPSYRKGIPSIEDWIKNYQDTIVDYRDYNKRQAERAKITNKPTI